MYETLLNRLKSLLKNFEFLNLISVSLIELQSLIETNLMFSFLIYLYFLPNKINFYGTCPESGLYVLYHFLNCSYTVRFMSECGVKRQ